MINLPLETARNTTLKKTKPRYTKEENDLIFKSWWDPQQRKKLTERLGREMQALRSQFCRLLKAKKLTIDQYYAMMQKEVNSVQESALDPFLQELSFLPGTVLNLEERVRKLEEQQKGQLDLRGFIEHLLAVERDLKKEDKLLEEIQRLVEEKEELRLLREKDLKRISKREEELNEVYKMLNQMLSGFMKLESVSKLTSLGDFMHSLQITVDQFGNVMKHKRI